MLMTADAHLSRFFDARMRAMPSNPQLQEIVAEIIRDFPGEAPALADMLGAIQDKLGYVPPSTVGLIADKTGTSRPDVYRAIELSPSLTLTPAGEHKLYICNADNCCMQGGAQLLQHAEQQLGIKAFECTPDRKIRLETFQCLGNCSMSPNVMLDGRVYGLMDPMLLDQLLERLDSN